MRFVVIKGFLTRLIIMKCMEFSLYGLYTRRDGQELSGLFATRDVL